MAYGTTLTGGCTGISHREEQSAAADLLLDIEGFMDHLDKTLGRLIRRKKPGPKMSSETTEYRVFGTQWTGAPDGCKMNLRKRLQLPPVATNGIADTSGR